MERSEALTALRTAAVDVLQVEPDKVTEDASFAEDLEADSLDLVELVMAIEDNLEVTIEEDQLADVKTVGDALDVIVAASTAAA
jgi:acyl carrier protein